MRFHRSCYQDCERNRRSRANCIIHVILPHEKSVREEENKLKQHLKRAKMKLHAIVKQEHETGWVLWEISARSQLLSFFFAAMLCRFVAIDISSTFCGAAAKRQPEGQGRKLRVIPLSTQLALVLVLYVQKWKKERKHRNKIAQEHVQRGKWGKFAVPVFIHVHRASWKCTQNT